MPSAFVISPVTAWAYSGSTCWNELCSSSLTPFLGIQVGCCFFMSFMYWSACSLVSNIRNSSVTSLPATTDLNTTKCSPNRESGKYGPRTSLLSNANRNLSDIAVRTVSDISARSMRADSSLCMALRCLPYSSLTLLYRSFASLDKAEYREASPACAPLRTASSALFCSKALRSSL